MNSQTHLFRRPRCRPPLILGRVRPEDPSLNRLRTFLVVNVVRVKLEYVCQQTITTKVRAQNGTHTKAFLKLLDLLPPGFYA